MVKTEQEKILKEIEEDKIIIELLEGIHNIQKRFIDDCYIEQIGRKIKHIVELSIKKTMEVRNSSQA